MSIRSNVLSLQCSKAHNCHGSGSTLRLSRKQLAHELREGSGALCDETHPADSKFLWPHFERQGEASGNLTRVGTVLTSTHFSFISRMLGFSLVVRIFFALSYLQIKIVLRRIFFVSSNFLRVFFMHVFLLF